MNAIRLITVDDEVLSCAGSGPIFGRMFFETSEQAFPDSGWTDFVAAFAWAWLAALLQFAKGVLKQQTVHFYDGPFCVELLAQNSTVIKLSFFERDVLIFETEGEVIPLLDNAHMTAEQVLSSCARRHWDNADVRGKTLGRGSPEVLSRAIWVMLLVFRLIDCV